MIDVRRVNCKILYFNWFFRGVADRLTLAAQGVYENALSLYRKYSFSPFAAEKFLTLTKPDPLVY